MVMNTLCPSRSQSMTRTIFGCVRRCSLCASPCKAAIEPINQDVGINESGHACRDPLFSILDREAGRALAPQDKTFDLDLAFVFDILGRFSEAEWMFSEAISVDPKSKTTQVYYEEHLSRWREGRTGPIL